MQKLNPRKHDVRLDAAEPANVAHMAREMQLRYVVITSVNRDDLEDGGSHHFAETVREVRRALPEARVEVLTPDFCGDLDAVARVLDAGPHVFNHNMETAPRLYSRVRPQADYRQSLDVLAFARAHAPEVLTKSGFMVGLGETPDEVRTLRDADRRQEHAGQTGRSALPLVSVLVPAAGNFPARRPAPIATGTFTPALPAASVTLTIAGLTYTAPSAADRVALIAGCRGRSPTKAAPS